MLIHSSSNKNLFKKRLEPLRLLKHLFKDVLKIQFKKYFSNKKHITSVPFYFIFISKHKKHILSKQVICLLQSLTSYLLLDYLQETQSQVISAHVLSVFKNT